jgi:hypothetical protein
MGKQVLTSRLGPESRRRGRNELELLQDESGGLRKQWDGSYLICSPTGGVMLVVRIRHSAGLTEGKLKRARMWCL